MDLYIYNPAIELQGVIDGYSSLRWRRRYFEPGEFELHCPTTDSNIALLREGNIIHRLDRQEAGIIEGIKIEETDTGGDEIAATGRMGSSMLDRRIITPTIFTGTVEDAMLKLVFSNAIIMRPLPYLALGVAGSYTPTVTLQITGRKNLLTVLKALSKSAPLGFRTRLDVPNKQWIFEVYDGVDRTVTQKNRPYVLFSDEFRNISKPKYVMDNTGYANFAYVGGKGNIVVEVDQTNGSSDRREIYVNATSVDKSAEAEDDFYYGGTSGVFHFSHVPVEIVSITADGKDVDYTFDSDKHGVMINTPPPLNSTIKNIYKYGLTDDEYVALLRQKGLEKLAEAQKSESFSADAVNTANFQYLTDWDLGDIVSFEKWGMRLDERITAVEEVDENGVVTVTPTCGSPLPETLKLGDDN